MCLECYNTYAARVSRGLTTWAQLQAEGLVGPPQRRGRPRKEMKPV